MEMEATSLTSTPIAPEVVVSTIQDTEVHTHIHTYTHSHVNTKPQTRTLIHGHKNT